MSRLLPLVVVLALAACGGQGEGDGSSGIRGRALAGPQCPVEIAGSPCPDLPFEGTVIATNVATGDVATVQTDADGRFRLSLPPGTYEVSIVSESPPPTAKPQTVQVEPGTFTAITLAVDTGIR
ncbi:MAG TPA: carboxypeptidase-like regulatory domain-containing protein [Actinomycetota bacterium]|nr:carboxypeptidase-like regulatory domain-containing protein [Actinomycetota bacterium]